MEGGKRAGWLAIQMVMIQGLIRTSAEQINRIYTLSEILLCKFIDTVCTVRDCTADWPTDGSRADGESGRTSSM